MELHAVEERVVVYRSGVGGSSTEGLDVGFSCPSEIFVGDRGEGHRLHVVDLDYRGAAPVDASDLDLWSRPEAVGDGDGPIGYSIAELRAELHRAIVTRRTGFYLGAAGETV